MTRERKFDITVISTMICIVIGVLGFKFVPMVANDFSKFTPQKWERYITQRYKMVADFESQHPIETLTIDNVLELLGEKNMSKWTMSDTTGFTYSASKSSLWGQHYQIQFDANGNCISRMLYQE